MSKGINHNSNGKQKRLQKLVWSIRSKLEEVGNGSHQSEAIIQKIDDMSNLDFLQNYLVEKSSEYLSIKKVINNSKPITEWNNS